MAIIQMRYNNAYQIYWDTKLEKLYDPIIVLLQKYLENKHYSEEVEELFTGIYCTLSRDVKQRPTFDKKNKALGFDIIIDYEYYMGLTEQEKKECIAFSLLRDIETLRKFKPKHFDLGQLKNDLEIFFQNIGWLKD